MSDVGVPVGPVLQRRLRDDPGVPEKYGPDRVNLKIRAVEAMERFLAEGPV